LEEKRILAIDYGEKRIGLAITDPLRIFPYPLTTILNNNFLFDELKKIFNEYSIELVLIGYPLKESGEKSRIIEQIEKFESKIKIVFDVKTEFVDERYSSEIAKQMILETVPSKKKRRDKSLVDKNAAFVMLQDYLNSIK
jgi:putative Holliday junction resolvase